MATGFHLRSALLSTLFSQGALVHYYCRALARARHWSHDCNLLAVDQVLLHALPIRQPERLVLIDWRGDQVADGFGSWNLMSYPICRDLDKQTQFFEGVFCRALTTVNLSTGGDYRPAAAGIVSNNYFQVLGVGSALGRVLTTHDDGTPNANPVAVVSYDFWETQLGRAPDVVGRKVLVNRHPLTIIGVAASTFKGIDVGVCPAIWIPASL